MKHRIFLAGYYGFGNTGDEAILQGLLGAFSETIPDVQFYVASARVEETSMRHGVEAVHWKDIKGLISAIRSSDLVVIGGGGLFHDYWMVDSRDLLTPRHNGLTFYAGIPLLASVLGKPCVAFGVGIGPLNSDPARELTRLALSQCDRVFVRDAESLEILESLSIGPLATSGFRVVADPAFILDPSSPIEIEHLIQEAGLDMQQSVLGVSLRHWDFDVEPDRWENEVAQALDAWAEETGGEILFLPLQVQEGQVYEDDLSVCERMMGRLKASSKAGLTNAQTRPEAILALISRCQLLLGMRMHSLLFAMKSGVPAVGLAYDPKVSRLMKAAGLEDLTIPVTDWNASSILARLRNASKKTDTRQLRVFSEEARHDIRHVISDLSALINSRSVRRLPQEGDLQAYALSKTREMIELQEQQEDLRNRMKELERRAAAHEERGRALDAALRRERLKVTQAEEKVHELEQKLKNENRNWEFLLGELEASHGAEKRASLTQLSELELRYKSLQREKESITNTLHRLQNTTGVKILAIYWRWMKRLFPVGSFQRKIAGKLRNILRRLLSAFIDPEKIRKPGFKTGFRTFGSDTRTKDHLDDEFQHFLASLEINKGQKTAIVFSPTQLREDEGQRSTHLALGLAREGFAVIYVYWRWHPTEWAVQDRVTEGVFQIPSDRLISQPLEWMRPFQICKYRVLLIEYPNPDLFRTLAIANTSGWLTIYDLVDDWDGFHSVGQAEWYDKEFEEHLVRSVDLILTVSPKLAEKVRGWTEKESHLLPNGTALDIHIRDQERKLERGSITVGYFGYLSDAWFDWDLLQEISQNQSDWLFYLIGYGEDIESHALPPNVIYLGKQPQTSLASFAENWDVAIVPFKSDSVAEAADPIKTYEYLAMGLPVVVTGVPPPIGAEDWVLKAAGAEDCVEKIMEANKLKTVSLPERLSYVENCRWSVRTDSLLRLIEQAELRIREKRFLLEV